MQYSKQTNIMQKSYFLAEILFLSEKMVIR